MCWNYILEKELPDASIDDFKFRLDSNGELSVLLRSGFKSKYTGKRIFWRYHDREGYGDPNLIVKFGEVDQNAEDFEVLKKNEGNTVLRYIYLTVVNESYPLWCVEKKVFIEL